LPLLPLLEKEKLDINVKGLGLDGPLTVVMGDGNSNDPEEINEELMCVE
jgi:hypothetical protein